MQRFWITLRAGDCQAPENGTPVYNSRKNLYACSTHENAVALAAEKTESEGGTWLVFLMTKIIEAQATQVNPTLD